MCNWIANLFYVVRTASIQCDHKLADCVLKLSRVAVVTTAIIGEYLILIMEC